MKLQLVNYSRCKTTNYIGLTWTISPEKGQNNGAFAYSGDYLYSGAVMYFNGHSVLPVLYLKSDITLLGSGTQEEPYTINQ